MKTKDQNTEKRILEAAKKVFLKKGLDGARMQEIAMEAGINKALLHYYFRSKEKLFMEIFALAFVDFFPKIELVFRSEKPLKWKINYFVNEYLDILYRNPHLPLFILHEIHRNPENLIFFFRKGGLKPELLFGAIKKEFNGILPKRIDFRHIVVSILSMCIFPVAAKPLLQTILFDKDEKEYDDFLINRKKVIPELIFNMLKIK